MSDRKHRLRAALVIAVLMAVAVASSGCHPPEGTQRAEAPSPHLASHCEPKDPQDFNGDPLSVGDCGDPADAVACRRDSDCAAPTCGPCGSGALVTHRALGLDCVVAACGSVRAAFCAPDHVCRIR
jgi:hypothetical protein